VLITLTIASIYNLILIPPYGPELAGPNHTCVGIISLYRVRVVTLSRASFVVKCCSNWTVV